MAHTRSRIAAAAALTAVALSAHADLVLYPGQASLYTGSTAIGNVGLYGGSLDFLASATIDINGTLSVNALTNPTTGQLPYTDPTSGVTMGGGILANGDGGLVAQLHLRGSTDISNGYLGLVSYLATLTVVNDASLVQRELGGLIFRSANTGPLTFINAAGGSFDLQNDLEMVSTVGPGQALFSNQAGATFSKTAGYSSFIDVPFDNSGTVSVSSGQLFLGNGGHHQDALFQATGPANAVYFGGIHQFAGHTQLGTNAIGGSYIVGFSGFGSDTGMRLAPGALVDLVGQMQVMSNVDYAGGEIRVNADSQLFNFAGATMRSTSGGTLTLQTGSYLWNEGVLQDSAGSTLVVGGQLTNRSGGQVTLVGQLQHSGGIDVQGGSTFTMAGAALSTPGATFNNAGTVVVAGHWAQNGALANSGQFTVGTAAVQLPGGVTLFGPGTITGSGTVTNSGSFMIASGATVTTESFTQTDGTFTVDGTFDSGFGITTQLLGGVLNGNGLINGEVFIGGGPSTAQFKPGHSPGSFTVNGALTMGTNSELELQVERAIDGSLAWDHVGASSISFLDGSLVHFIVGTGVATASALSLDFLDCGSGCSFGAGVGFVIDGAPGATFSYGANGLQLTIAPIQAVPEPAQSLLLLAGLLALATLQPRPQRAACEQPA